MRAYLVRTGEEGMTALKRAADVESDITIHRYIKGETTPSEHAAYKMALTIGCTDEKAVALASDSPPGAKETA